jgi:hypothetical protein
MSPFSAPLACTEVLISHPELPPSLPAVPAIPRTGGWAFRPSVLTSIIDAMAGRLGTAAWTEYRFYHQPGQKERSADLGTALLAEPNGEYCEARRISRELPHCTMPTEFKRAFREYGWGLADRHQPAMPGTEVPTGLAVLVTPNGYDREAVYVDAPTDVETRPTDEWVFVAARWINPPLSGALLVPAGRVSLYEKEFDDQPCPERFADNEMWLPYCTYCDEPLFDPGAQPGMYYPQPDNGPSESPWCSLHPRPDRRRPHAAAWRLTTN